MADTPLASVSVSDPIVSVSTGPTMATEVISNGSSVAAWGAKNLLAAPGAQPDDQMEVVGDSDGEGGGASLPLVSLPCDMFTDSIIV